MRAEREREREREREGETEIYRYIDIYIERETITTHRPMACPPERATISWSLKPMR